MIEIKNGVVISEDELVFTFSRSGGPGGQNVNKVNTRVTVFFDVANCPFLSDYQKKRIFSVLRTRASKAGVIHVASQQHRTQRANRQAAISRLAELLTKALERKPVRRKTKLPKWANQHRLDAKKRRGTLKQQRTKKPDID